MELYEYPLPLKLLEIMFNKRALTGWGMWCLAAVFYGYEFVHRVLPSTMVPEWAAAFAFGNPIQLGSLAAMYFYAYSLCQIPAGMLMDKFGTRFWLAFACLILTLGSYLLSITHSIVIAHISRLLIGTGSAFAFIGCLKIAAEWLEPRFFPLAVGLTSLCGTVGAIIGGKPLAHWVANYYWRDIMTWLTLISFLLTILLWFGIRKNNAPTFNPAQIRIQSHNFLLGLKRLLTHPQTWLITCYGALVVIPVVAFGEMWADYYLHEVFDITRQDAAGARSYLFMGIALGGPTIGWLVSRYTYPRIIMATSTCFALIILSSIIYLPVLTLNEIKSLFFIYGFFTSNMLLCFALITTLHPREFNGLAIGFTNMAVMIAGGTFQHLIGKILDIVRIKDMPPTLPISAIDFRISLSVLPICLIVAIFLTRFIQYKESRI